MVESDTARVSVLPVAGCKFPAVFFGEGRLGCGRSGRWPDVSPSGFGGNFADFDGRANPVGISPQTCTKLSLFGSSLSSMDRKCGCSAVSSSCIGSQSIN